MKVHILVDYSFLYYKYKFQLDSGRMHRLTCNMEWHGEVIDKDISQVYYSLREIEGFRRDWEGKGHDVVVTVCFDMPSSRKSEHTAESDKYKSNRGHKLNDEDFENIQFAQQLLEGAGHNTYRIHGYEADDLVNYMVKHYKDEFDATVIYTPDADLLVHVCNNVAVMRYKSGKQYTLVTRNNFSEYLGQELKCNMPYNALTLYKCTVGDKSDCIDGIKGFGPAAFNKLISYLNVPDWSNMASPEATYELLGQSVGYLGVDKIQQAIAALDLVKPYEAENVVITKPTHKSTRDLREASYGKYKMVSLID